MKWGILIVSIFLLACTCIEREQAKEERKDKNLEEMKSKMMESNPEACMKRFYESETLPFPEKPSLKDEKNFKILVVSDMHNRKIIEPGYDFTVTCGDNVAHGYESEYQDLQDDIYFTVGNWEVANNGWEYWKKYVGYSNHYYWEIGSLCLISIDTGSACLCECQQQWLRKVLENTKCSNKIILTHINIILYYDNITLKNICEEYGVQLCVFGNQHNYFYTRENDVDYLNLNDYWEGGENTLLKVMINNDKMKWILKNN